MIVCKFGGTSMADATQIRKVSEIVKADPRRRIAVVSAPGKRFRSDKKVTDMLIELADECLVGNNGVDAHQAVLKRFYSLATELGLGDSLNVELETALNRVYEYPKHNAERYTNQMKAIGEDLNARIFAAFLQHEGVTAAYVNPCEAGLVLAEQHNSTVILPESYRNLKNLPVDQMVIVFPGFFGADNEGNVLTFSRGGSDISGAVLAATFDAELYENWTDVDCVYAADPKIVSNPKSIPEMSYIEMRELSYTGFSVLHPEAMEPAMRRNIPIRICNTNNPDHPGTRIVCHRSDDHNLVTGIAGSPDFCLITIRKFLLNRELGAAARILTIFAEEGVLIEHMPTGIDSISIITKDEQLPRAKARQLIRRLHNELGYTDITLAYGLAGIMIVGEAMTDMVGVTARACTALSLAGVSIEVVIQDYNEISLLLVVDIKDCQTAIAKLYAEFFD